jgi:histidinol-phosphate/aromatic aminotransferase/cobyric acid decarboxylase-like protein
MAPALAQTPTEAALERAPGRRLAVLGDGERASALAATGWQVTEVDATAAVRDERWPPASVDAVLVGAWAGRRIGVERKRLLRRARRHLVPGGLLVVEGADLLRPLIRPAGFTPDGGTEGLLVARALPQAPHALAPTAWGVPGTARLDLRYAPEEAELLDPQPSSVWEEALQDGAELAAHYPVDDPYGGERGATAVSGFHGCSVAPGRLTFGAGVTSLLHALAGLADGGAILAPELVHPDLEIWAMARGSRVQLLPEPLDVAAFVRAVADLRPALVHLDRPAFAGDVLSLADVEAIATAAARVGAAMVIDESPAVYLGGRASAVGLTDRCDALVVLRGFTKAFSWGGLRVGYAVASPPLAARVRELVPPMLTGGPALAAALRMLAAGDSLGPLRARIRARRPAVSAILQDHGLELLDGHPDLSWLAVRDPGRRVSSALTRAGIRGLEPVPVPGAQTPRLEALHLTLPLSDERFALLSELIGGARL